MRNSRILIYVIIGLAAIGLFSQLFTNPLGMIKWLFFTAVFAAIIITVIKLFVRKTNPTSNEMKKYRQALKQSKQRYQHQQKSSRQKQSNPSQMKRRRKRPTHLRVIEGEKSKNKNRATFE